MEILVEKNEVKDTALKILDFCIANPKDTATVLAFFGDLGVGKTTMTQSIASVLGIQETVNSPTFTLMKSYIVSDPKKYFTKLVHIDAYRLESGSELSFLGWEDLLKDKKSLIVVEWPANIINFLPKNTHNIEFSHIDENKRLIKIVL